MAKEEGASGRVAMVEYVRENQVKRQSRVSEERHRKKEFRATRCQHCTDWTPRVGCSVVMEGGRGRSWCGGGSGGGIRWGSFGGGHGGVATWGAEGGSER